MAKEYSEHLQLVINETDDTVPVEPDIIENFQKLDGHAKTTDASLAAVAGTPAALETEEQQRIAGDSALSQSIDTEAAARAAGDTANAENLTAEINARQSGDAGLQAAVDQTEADLLAETTARQNADTALQGDVDLLTTGLTNEANTRASADANLNTAITGVSADLDAETTARTTGDADTLAAAQAAVDDETAARTAADTAINNALTLKADLIDGKVDPTQIPSIALNNVTPVESEAEMLALTAEPGDLAKRTDLPGAPSFMLSVAPATLLANWTPLHGDFALDADLDAEISARAAGDSNAIATASADATTKADAARDAAISTAATDATTKADAAEADALAGAALDATAKADAAEAAAIAAAATDATTKADNARTTAISTAATDATTKADAAEAAAVATAATDATAKADAAEADAIAAAATDATAKANAAQAAAATDATTKVDAEADARIAADALKVDRAPTSEPILLFQGTAADLPANFSGLVIDEDDNSGIVLDVPGGALSVEKGVAKGDLVLNAMWPAYGAKGDGTTEDGPALQAWLDDCIDQQRKGYLPKAPSPLGYKCSQGLVAATDADKFNLSIEGDGYGSFINFADNLAYDGLTIGNEVPSPPSAGVGSHPGPQGYLKGVRIAGPTNRPVSADKRAALKLRGVRQFSVEQVQLDKFEIGLDLVGNCYGSQFINNRIGFGSTVTVGANLRTGIESGADLTFINNWIMGHFAAVHVSPGSEGYHFFGGQLNAGNYVRTVDDDTSGVVVSGKDYVTGSTTGDTGAIQFKGVDFEAFQRCWAFRTYGFNRITVEDSAFLATNSTDPAIGIFKGETANASVLSFKNNVVRGTYSSAALLSITGATSSFSLWEEGWFFGTPTTINGVAQSANFARSLADQSSFKTGASWRARRNGRTEVSHEGIKQIVGAGNPEGSVVAPAGSTYNRIDGGAGTSYYVKETGTGTSGWVAK